ncbi:hypothetical protein [Streptomyces sp. NPDC003952]
MRETRLIFSRGDRVRATRDLYRGDIPAGEVGTFRYYDSVSTLWGPDDRQTVAVVDFPSRVGAVVGLRAIEVVCPAADVSDLTDARAERLARAHEAVAKAYRDLAYALNDLKAAEAR